MIHTPWTFEAYLEGERLAEQGMARAETNADPTWKEQVQAEIIRRARTFLEFTAEDVRDVVGDPPDGTSPNAMGSLFRNAAKRRWIAKISRVPARRPTLHVHEIGLWVGLEPPLS